MGFLLVFALFSSCKPSVSTVIFHSDMGEMTVCISSGLPAGSAAQLEALLTANPDSLAVGRVLHDGFVELNFQAPDVKDVVKQDRAPLSGAFVVSGGRFFIVQGREHTDATLDKWEKQTRRKINPAFREQYKKKGGALQLEGNCVVLGTLVSGKETLDRIAALPSNADGRPLRAVKVRVERQK